MHAVFGAHPHQKFAIAAKFFGPQRGLAIKIADIAKHLAPLAGQQIDHMHPFGLPFQQGSGWAEKVDMRVRRDPALLAPMQHLFQFKNNLLGGGRDRKPGANGGHLVALADLNIDLAQRQIGHTFAVDIGILVQPVDKLAIVVFKPIAIDPPMIAAWGQIFALHAMKVNAHRHRLTDWPDQPPGWCTGRWAG